MKDAGGITETHLLMLGPGAFGEVGPRVPTNVFAVGRECCALTLRVNFRFQDCQQLEAGVGVELPL